MKITVYIDNVNHEHKEITDSKEIAQLVKDHISHLGKVSVYYEKPFNELSWWYKFLRIGSNNPGSGF